MLAPHNQQQQSLRPRWCCGSKCLHYGSPSCRKGRLDQCVATTLYHQTSIASAQAIGASKEMLRGTSGLAGGGIYFATSMADTQHKAHQHGCMLQVKVKLGRVKTISSHGDSTIT